MAIGCVCQIINSTLLCRHRENLSASSNKSTLAIRRHCACITAYSAELGTRRKINVVERNIYLFAAAVSNSIFVYVSAILKDNIFVRCSGEFNIILLKISEFGCCTTLCIIFEEVHRVVAVADKVDAVAYPHREKILILIFSQLFHFCGTNLVHPNLISLSTLIVFPCAELAEHTVEGKLLTIGRIRTPRTLGHGNLHRRATLGIHFEHKSACAAESVPLRAEKNLFTIW